MAYSNYGYGSSLTTMTYTYGPLKFTVYVFADDWWIGLIGGYTRNLFPFNYDVHDSSNKPSMSLKPYSIHFLNIENKKSETVWIHMVTLMTVVDDIFISRKKVAWDNLWSEGKHKIRKGQSWSTLYDEVMQGPNTNKFTENADWTLDRAGNMTFAVYCKWEDSRGIHFDYFKCDLQPQLRADQGDDTVFNHPVTVHDRSLVALTPYSQQITFYRNEPFSLGNSGQLRATYKYVVDGSTYEEPVLTNFTSVPSIGAKVTNQTQAVFSFKTVSCSYPITIHGINEDTTFANLPKLPEYIKLGEYTADLVSNATITYADGTTTSAPTNVSALVTPGFVGYFSVAYNAYASKTKQFVHWGEKDGSEIVPYTEDE